MTIVVCPADCRRQSSVESCYVFVHDLRSLGMRKNLVVLVVTATVLRLARKLQTDNDCNVCFRNVMVITCLIARLLVEPTVKMMVFVN